MQAAFFVCGFLKFRFVKESNFPRPPRPDKALAPPKEVSDGPTLDYEFFEQTCL
jgi:hypothetical protein